MQMGEGEQSATSLPLSPGFSAPSRPPATFFQSSGLAERLGKSVFYQTNPLLDLRFTRAQAEFASFQFSERSGRKDGKRAVGLLTAAFAWLQRAKPALSSFWGGER